MRELILGIIQGVTEFLPISSSGHLALIQYFYQGIGDADILLDILLHLGTLCVVFLYYRNEIMTICNALFLRRAASVDQTQNEQQVLQQKMFPLILVGSIPTAIIGLALKSFIEQHFTSLFLVGGALLLTGAILYAADRFMPAQNKFSISYLDALVIGTVQGIAVFPGISRSGSTISTGILLGIDRAIAAQYSFLLSVPAILGAVILEGKDLLILTQTPHLIPYLIGTLAAFATGYAAITALIKVVVQRKLSWFSWYCWIIGGLTLIYGVLA